MLGWHPWRLFSLSRWRSLWYGSRVYPNNINKNTRNQKIFLCVYYNTDVVRRKVMGELIDRNFEWSLGKLSFLIGLILGPIPSRRNWAYDFQIVKPFQWRKQLRCVLCAEILWQGFELFELRHKCVFQCIEEEGWHLWISSCGVISFKERYIWD